MNRFRRCFSALAMGFACAGGCDDPEIPVGPDVDTIFAEYAVPGSPGAAVMVIQNGRVLHAEGYGEASIEDGTPMLPTTPVRLASVSKAFTCWGIVLLEEQGLLTFDTPAAEIVPEIARFPGITIRHLMNHTSGIADYYQDSPLAAIGTDASRTTPLQNAEAAALFETWGEPRAEPGERYEYSNPAYEILALIIERVSGMSYADFLETNVFEPLGMETAAVRELPTTVIPGRAIGHTRDGDDWEVFDDHWANWMVGAGGIYASVEDMYRWDQALWAWAGEGRLDEVLAPAILNDGSESLYGFGWGLEDRLGRRSIQHSGGWVGFVTYFARYLDEGLSVIVLTNAQAPAGELADAVARLYLEE